MLLDIAPEALLHSMIKLPVVLVNVACKRLALCAISTTVTLGGTTTRW